MSSISSTSSITNPYLVSGQNNFGQIFKNLKDVGSALQSGDLATAQSAFASLQQSIPANSQSSSSSASSGPFGSNTQANTDYQSLATALNSNDTAGAQKALASLQSDLKTGHKGHHHHASGATASAAPSTTAQASNSQNSKATIISSIGTDSDGDNDGGRLNVSA